MKNLNLNLTLHPKPNHSLIFYRSVKNELIKYNSDIKLNILDKILKFNIFSVGNITFILHPKKYFYIEIDNKDPLITYHSIKSILAQIYSIESKGFLNNLNLEGYPVISNFIKHFTKSNDFLRMNKSSESFKWIFNLILLLLHELVTKTLYSLKETGEVSDITVDLLTVNKEILAKLDPSIRKKLQNRGITLTQNIYAGFDTEFKRISENRNKLLSVQLAVNTKLLLKIPKNDPYVLSSIDVITGKEYKIAKTKDFNFNIIEKTINLSVFNIRILRSNNDFNLMNLIHELKMLKINFIERDDDYVFSFNRSAIQPFIFYGDSFSMEDLINQINLIGEPIIKKDSEKVILLLANIHKKLKIENENENEGVPIDFNFNDGAENLKLKPIVTNDKPVFSKNMIKNLTRSSMTSFTDDKISVTKIKNIHIIAHVSKADLSMLSDFDIFKNKLDIVQKSFITLSKPILINGNNIHIKDTILLAPDKMQTLKAIGELYPGLEKIEISTEDKENMDVFLEKDKELFQEYAIRDAIITLTHANHMEDFFLKLKGNGIPNTISKISGIFVKDYWRRKNYKGYQISNEFLLSNTSNTITPKGLWAITKDSDVGLKINYFIAAFKGGRNECFMFGIDKITNWFDYDLASAYTTVMAFAGNPDYKKARKLNLTEFLKMTDEELIFSYTVIDCVFNFKDKTKYPSIPCFVDKSSTAYPLKGKAVITGIEFVLAKNQGCFITVKEVYTIPFESKLDPNNHNKKVFTNQPFLDIVKHCQAERRKHTDKNSILNQIWKLLANAIFGLTGQGLNERLKFNIKTNSMVRMEAGELSNPIIASWITAFIRTIIGETLDNIHRLNGKIVSVTTDGFITDVEDLENKLLELKNKNILFLNFYRKFRGELSSPSSETIVKKLSAVAFELKNSGIGIITWTTRGQISLNAGIKAATGFQAGNYTLSELNDFFTYILSTENKSLEYIQKTLTTTKNLFLHGGHLTPVYRDQIFRLHFDNKRIIIDNSKNFDFSNVLLDSVPVKDIQTCSGLRDISKILKTKTYQKHSNIQWGNTYKKFTDLAIRNFIKAVLTSPPLYSLPSFDNYQDIIDFIKLFDPSIIITKQKISNLKNRKLIFKSVPKIEETIKFGNFLKKKFPYFKDNEFFK